jgi:parvulin-like peptidyl-prolyl isomerase
MTDASDAKAHARHILLEHEYEANDILAKLRAGDSFEDLARIFSKCPSSLQGGDLGSFKRGRMVEAFDEAVFAMKPAEISPPVRTRFGYHIIQRLA